jgi:Lipocalin-like domain
MTIARVSAAVVLAVVAAGQIAQAQTDSPSNPLVGTWTLTSLINKDANGNRTHPWGVKPAGIFIFGPDGHFAEIIINEEKANTSLDYFGTYSVDNGKILRLHVVGSSAPQFRGKDIERQITLGGDQLSYGNTNPSVGG